VHGESTGSLHNHDHIHLTASADLPAGQAPSKSPITSQQFPVSGGVHRRQRYHIRACSRVASLLCVLIGLAFLVPDLQRLHALLRAPAALSTAGPCRPDTAGHWAIGMFYGSSPLVLQPLELYKGGAWRSNASSAQAANPVVTCASAPDRQTAFVRSPSLLQRGDSMFMFFEAASAGAHKVRPWHMCSA